MSTQHALVLSILRVKRVHHHQSHDSLKQLLRQDPLQHQLLARLSFLLHQCSLDCLLLLFWSPLSQLLVQNLLFSQFSVPPWVSSTLQAHPQHLPALPLDSVPRFSWPPSNGLGTCVYASARSHSFLKSFGIFGSLPLSSNVRWDVCQLVAQHFKEFVELFSEDVASRAEEVWSCASETQATPA